MIPDTESNIVLIGMRGCGKTTIARTLAEITRWPVHSLDQLITHLSGTTIAQLVAEQGWHTMREIEYQAVLQVTNLKRTIIDCGGGVVVDLDNTGDEIFSTRKVAALRGSGTIVWLRGDPARAAKRTAIDPERPRLDPRYGEEQLMRRREPLYAQAADIEVNTLDKTSAMALGWEILELLRNHWTSTRGKISP